MEKKCIDRAFIEATLAQVSKEKSQPPNMALIAPILASNGWTTTEVLRIEKNIVHAINDYTDPTNEDVAAIADKLNVRLAAQKSVDISLFLDDVRNNQVVFESGLSLYDDLHYLIALAIVVFNETL